MSQSYHIVFNCPDAVGIVTRVGALITDNNGWISRATHHSDEESGWFFSRIVVSADSLPFGLDELKRRFVPIAEDYKMEWSITDSRNLKKLVIMASKGSHCLSDILDRWHSGDLQCDIPCVIANHEDLRGLVELYGIAFHHVPIEKENKERGFAETERLIAENNADCVVLARYMQIIPQALCEKYRHKIINIHHSFLPSFIGAKPYHQASRRGVKLIGATCHYVTEQLDEGPIIEQDVVRVTHQENASELVRRGKDVEKIVLARGLRAHLEDRILVHGNKTVVLN